MDLFFVGWNDVFKEKKGMFWYNKENTKNKDGKSDKDGQKSKFICWKKRKRSDE